MISIIVAVDENLGIGKDNSLMWHLSDDLKRFKAITMDHTVIMGKNTWLSLPFKPLKGRRNIIISSSLNEAQGAEIVKSIDLALETSKNDKTFIIGGDSIYKQMIHLADELIVTQVYKVFDADTFFPEINPSIWEIAEESHMMHDEKSNLKYKYITYRKIK